MYPKLPSHLQSLISDILQDAEPVEEKPKPNEQITLSDEITESEREDLILKADELLEKGNIEEAESFYDEALVLYVQSKEIYKRIGHQKGIVESHLKIANVHFHQGNFDQAISLLEFALGITTHNQMPLLQAEIFSSFGRVYESKDLSCHEMPLR